MSTMSMKVMKAVLALGVTAAAAAPIVRLPGASAAEVTGTVISSTPAPAGAAAAPTAKALPKVEVIATGGTIAGQSADAAGADR